ncbi:mite allergen Lep d 7-like [Lycorma delicatula]|uniref:mite allergen Lep d 7-like n=1 Tax=Lycorma delicatula TaxID=130591 RepID=UPI003F514492
MCYKMSRWVLLMLLVITYSYQTNSQDVLSNSVTDELVINKVVDELLKYVRTAIKDLNVDRLAVPDLKEVFTGPFGISGEFNASNGSVAYLSTVYRTGDATVKYGKMVTTLSLDLGLKNLVVDYNNYKAKFLDIGPTGKMRATIGQNSVYLSIFLYYNIRNCSEELGLLVMDQFDDINVKLTGLDPLNWLLDDIATWVAKDFHDNIKYLIENTLRQAIKTALVTYNVCKFLPHLPFGEESNLH